MHKFANMPIVRQTLAWTGKLDGDDSGYRDVNICPLDAENPDPLVPVETVATRPLYAVGKTIGLCEYYPQGLGAPNTTLVRKPVVSALEAVDQSLRPYDRQLLVVDGWRSWRTQQGLWRYLRAEILRAEGLEDVGLSIYDEVRVGIKADDVGSYCAIIKDEAFHAAISELVNGPNGQALAAAAPQFGKDILEVAELYVTFLANLNRNDLKIQEDAVTAHGNGGACDCWLINRNTGKFVNLGVPFDYVPAPGTEISAGVVNYFDMPEVTTEVYAEAVAKDPILQAYLGGLGISVVTDAVFHEAQLERRLLFHAMRSVGWTYFSLTKECGEPWHYNAPNFFGGNQVAELPGSGNGCHALLADVRERVSGKPMAVWDNGVAHKLAEQILGPRL